jgi:hypothetical protein
MSAANWSSCTTRCRYAIDINDPFLSSRLFGTGWDDPQMAGYACWYNLQQIFSWLAVMGWRILHTGLTTRGDLLQRFSVRQPFSAGNARQLALCLALVPAGQRRGPPARLAATARSCRGYRRSRSWGSGTVFLNRWRTIPFPFTAAGEADFLACQADANELLDLAQVDSQKLAASENYPVHKLRKLHSALRQRQLLLPLWLLSWNTLTGDTRDTNGRFFRGALLMDNLLGLADQVWLAGFWLNSGLQGEARANGKLDTSSLALHYLHGLPRPVYWVLWLWRGCGARW